MFNRQKSVVQAHTFTVFYAVLVRFQGKLVNVGLPAGFLNQGACLIETLLSACLGTPPHCSTNGSVLGSE